MQETFEEKNKRQQLLIIVFVAVIFITCVIVYLNFFRPSGEAPAVSTPSTPSLSDIDSGQTTIPSLLSQPQAPALSGQSVNIDLLIESLRDFDFVEAAPIEVGKLGRDNPFEPLPGFEQE